MEMQIHATTIVRPTVENSHCSFESCEDAAAVDLGARPLCAAHFFPVCTQELESSYQQLRTQPFEPGAIESFKNFLGACAKQAQELGSDRQSADVQTQAQCMQFLLRISQLGQRLRRSPRMAAAVPVWLRREDLNRTWEDETHTTTISRHGAGLVCHYPVQTGGTLILCRKNGGARVRARVVYCDYDSDGRRQIGVEFLDPQDIWGLGS